MRTLKTNLRQQLKSSGVNLMNEIGEVALVYNKKHRVSDESDFPNADRQRRKITSSENAQRHIRAAYKEGEIEHREFFKVLLLSRANLVLGVVAISSGGVSGTVADPKLIFQSALLANASSIIVGHNHPSGELKPSQADITITNKIKEAGKMLDIPVLDHIILSPESDYAYLSMADEGIIS